MSLNNEMRACVKYMWIFLCRIPFIDQDCAIENASEIYVCIIEGSIYPVVLFVYINITYFLDNVDELFTVNTLKDKVFENLVFS